MVDGQDIGASSENRGLSPIIDAASKRTACAQANRFVREQFNLAWAALRRGDRDLALFEFGLGLHTLQDSTSPTHRGFQVWTGSETLLDEVAHVSRELWDYHSTFGDSNLDVVTRNAWEWFKRMKLPEGNLMACECA